MVRVLQESGSRVLGVCGCCGTEKNADIAFLVISCRDTRFYLFKVRRRTSSYYLAKYLSHTVIYGMFRTKCVRERHWSRIPRTGSNRTRYKPPTRRE